MILSYDRVMNTNLGNSSDKLHHTRSVAYSVELVLLNKQQISGGRADLHCYRNLLSQCRYCSSDGTNLTIPRTRTKFGERAFSVAIPSIWNSLPEHIRSATNKHVFKCRLKTYYFKIHVNTCTPKAF